MPQISVSKLSAQLGDQRAAVASLHATIAALVSEDVTLVEEINGIDSTDETRPRIDAITARRSAIKTEHTALTAKMDAAIAKRDATQAAYESAVSANTMDAHLSASAGSLLGGSQNAGAHERGNQVNVLPPSREQMTADIGQMVRVIAASRTNRDEAIRLATAWGNDRVRVAMEAGSFTAGGFLVPENYQPEMVRLLYNRTIIRRLGTPVWPLVNGNLTLPKMTSGSTAAYIGESTNPTPSQPGGGQIKFTAKKLVALVPVSNDLLRFSNPRADEAIRDDLVRQLAIAEDAAFLRGQGLGNAPKGLRYWCLAANLVQANATVNLDNVSADLASMEAKLLTANVPMTRPAWILSPRSAMYLKYLRNSTGTLAFPEMGGGAAATSVAPDGPQGMLRGYPYFHTAQLPINITVGGHTTTSEIYLVDADELVIAEDPNIVLQASDTAAYYDGSAVQAAYSLDQTVVRAIAQHDFGPRHAEAIACMYDVTF